MIESTAPSSNSGLKGNSFGREIKSAFSSTEKFTIPMQTARIYPAISPKSTDRERKKLLANT